MSEKSLIYHSKEIKNALFQTLLKRLPPKEFSTHLEDLVAILIDALSEGELEINFENTIDQTKLKSQGWPQAHKAALIASGWTTGESAPFVLSNNQLSLRRWHHEMNEVVKSLIYRSNSKRKTFQSTKKREALMVPNGLNHEQSAAVQLIESEGVVLLSGGPGTGKTSTVMRMLETALSLNSGLKIGLAAPTGKAARRLQDSLQKGITTIKSPYQKELIRVPCNTLHRWLQSSPNGFAKNAQKPLDLELLIIDEMSMVELSLMQALLEALPIRSQLILVGDPNQLPPIGSGAIWHHLHKENIHRYFGKGAVRLHQTYRNRGELALLSKVLCEQGLNSFWSELIKLPASANIQTHQCKSNIIPNLLLKRLKDHSQRLGKLTQRLMEGLVIKDQQTYMRSIKMSDEAQELFYCLEELIVLCPKRYGSWGVDEIHKVFLGKNVEHGFSSWPQGTPVMCNENLPDLDLSNGDIGVVIGEGDQRRLLFRIVLEGGELVSRFIHPARLKILQPALAMTIHKAQGSEANEVIVLLPGQYTKSFHAIERTNKDKSYEERLVYTAITRAKNNVQLIIEHCE